MAELTEDDIISKINTIDTQIATIVTALTGGTTAAEYVDYTMGDKTIAGSQKLEQLMKLRETYQGLLNNFPKEVTRVHGYDVDRDGTDNSDFEGDQ